jgi:putative salt-induced outer membrane protein YdiY
MPRPPPLPARARRRWRLAGAFLGALALARAGVAQEPTFTFTQPEPTPGVTWKGSGQLGLTATSGNSDAVGATLGARLSRRSGRTRVSGEARGAYARSQINLAVESDGVEGIGPAELHTVTQTTTEAWELRLRVDRYLGERNSLYASAAASGDRPAGKRLLGEAQLGYARALVLSPVHELTVELGYDLAHQDFVTSSASTTSHSARAFVGYQILPWRELALRLSVDSLANLAPEHGPTGTVEALHHARVLARAEADVKVGAKGAIGLRLRARYDSAPAPLPQLGGQAFEPGFVPLAERLDRTTELVFVYTPF